LKRIENRESGMENRAMKKLPDGKGFLSRMGEDQGEGD